LGPRFRTGSHGPGGFASHDRRRASSGLRLPERGVTCRPLRASAAVAFRSPAARTPDRDPGARGRRDLPSARFSGNVRQARRPTTVSTTTPSGTGTWSSTPRLRPGPTGPGIRASGGPRSSMPWPPCVVQPGRQFSALPLATPIPAKFRPRSSPYWRRLLDHGREVAKSTFGQ